MAQNPPYVNSIAPKPPNPPKETVTGARTLGGLGGPTRHFDHFAALTGTVGAAASPPSPWAEKPANNDVEAPLEPVGIVLDDDGDPALPCATCGGCGFHQSPGDRWRCSACEPLTLPGDASALTGWSFCSLPADPDGPAQNASPGAVGGAQDADPAPGQSEAPPTADAPPGAPPAAWDDDREWIRQWREAGPTLPHRLPVARAWITAAPSPPLPRCLASIEIRRIAAQHGIAVEIAHRVEEFAP